MPRLRILAIGLLVTACGSSVQPTTSVPASSAPSASSAPAGNLPPGCEPISLSGPSGERIELNGVWLEDVDPGAAPMTWWIQTAGDCVWGAGQVDDVPPPEAVGASVDDVQSLNGRIGSDFVITGDIIWLAPLPISSPGNPARYAALRMLIEFDDAGGIVLREDRQPGVEGPRCPDPGGYCPNPLVLRPVD